MDRPGLEHTGSGVALLTVALIFGLINAAVKPVLVVFSCPLVVLTFGLFLLVINGAMLLVTAWVSDLFDLGFAVDGLNWGILGSIVISLTCACTCLNLSIAIWASCAVMSRFNNDGTFKSLRARSSDT